MELLLSKITKVYVGHLLRAKAFTFFKWPIIQHEIRAWSAQLPIRVSSSLFNLQTASLFLFPDSVITNVYKHNWTSISKQVCFV